MQDRRHAAATIFLSQSTLHIVFENITVFYLLLWAFGVEKVFMWMVNSNEPAILMIVSL